MELTCWIYSPKCYTQFLMADWTWVCCIHPRPWLLWGRHTEYIGHCLSHCQRATDVLPDSLASTLSCPFISWSNSYSISSCCIPSQYHAGAGRFTKEAWDKSPCFLGAVSRGYCEPGVVLAYNFGPSPCNAATITILLLLRRELRLGEVGNLIQFQSKEALESQDLNSAHTPVFSPGV